MKEQHNIAYRTDEYDMFKRLEGNRTIMRDRVSKIIQNVLENGYIYNPVILNEKNEVIDGQARVQAFKELGIPVDYIVEPGLTVENCRALNKYSTPWKMRDYIESYAELGCMGYTYLKKLMEKYPKTKAGVLIGAAKGTVPCYGAALMNTIKDGDFSIDADGYENAIETLEWLNRFSGYIDKDKGKNDYTIHALMIARILPEIDNAKMEERFKKYFSTDIVKPFINVRGAIMALDACYNYKTSAKRVRLDVLYDEWLESKGVTKARAAHDEWRNKASWI